MNNILASASDTSQGQLSIDHDDLKVEFAMGNKLRHWCVRECKNGHHMCTLCGKMLKSLKSLHNHGKVHKRQNHYCNVCHKTFIHFDKFVVHQKSHSGIRPYLCKYCNVDFTFVHFYKKHMEKHTDVSLKMTCNMCGKNFDDLIDLTEHIKIHPISYSCDKCWVSCDNKKELKSHMKIHCKDKKFKCTYCDKRCVRYINLRSHMTTHQKKPIQCGYCDKVSMDAYKIKRHEKVHLRHIVKCDQCEKVFSNDGVLQSHIKKVHVSEFKCDTCDNVTYSYRDYKSHLGIHDNSLKCACGKVYFKIYHLQRHQKRCQVKK
ncbi:putative zinc-finger containing protein [Namao virus]|nr:putative zinc-finger containing protein [Namao virus]